MSRRKTDLGISCRSKSAKVVLGAHAILVNAPSSEERKEDHGAAVSAMRHDAAANVLFVRALRPRPHVRRRAAENGGGRCG
jgi:hypothetical protein